MNSDERAILDYIKSWPDTFVSGREIARRAAGKRRYSEDRHWAVPVLAEMVNKGILESNSLGQFRVKREETKKNRLRRHVSPQFLRVLKDSGKTFEGIVIDVEDDSSSQPAT